MALCLLFLSTSSGVLAQAAEPAGSSTMVALHPAVTLHSGDKVVGPLDVHQPVHVVVTLKLRNEQQLDEYIAQPGFRPLTSGQFRMLYAPTKVQAQTVADYLTKAGFSNVKIAAGNALVVADGRADTAQAAFQTSFVHVKTHDGRDAFANSSAVQIPANLKDVVRAVLGVQNVHISSAMIRPYDPIAAHTTAMQTEAAGVATGHQPSDFPVIYGASGMANVTSVPVGSISSGPMANVLNDLQSADPGVTVTLKGDTSVGSDSGTNSGDSEWDLDSQDIIAFTGVKQYYFYVANSNGDGDLATDVAQVVSDNVLKVIDYSLGECESYAQLDGTAAAMDTSFKQAVAQGQTFFVSAGDQGANECDNTDNVYTPDYPASSPYVTSVGGTELYTSPNTVWQNEVVWNGTAEDEGTTGGSPSKFEPIPSWQKNVMGITNQVYRGVPDIAFDASPDTGALITVDGQANQQWGGTSLSAPLAAGMWARVLQADGTSLGFASPVIYSTAQSSEVNYADIFHDITSGNNNGYSAGFSWDYTSGWGSVVVNQFASQIATVNAGAQVVSFATLPALQVTTPIPGSTHTPGDFTGSGTSDILWFNSSTSQVGYWAMSATVSSSSSDGGGVTRTGLKTYNVTPGYFVGAVGDFNDDGYADLIFTSANHDLWLWTNNQQGGWTSSYIGTYPSQWQLIGAGDINGDGYDDLLWLNPSACEFGYWTMQGATRTGLKIIPITCGYYPISIGYYTPSNRLSIMWTSAANDLYVWDSTGSSTGGSMGNGFNAYDLTPYLSAGYQIVSIGGGYEGKNIGIQACAFGPAYGCDAQALGMGLTRSFNANGIQTGVQPIGGWSATLVEYDIGAAGYVIAGNGVNNTGVYNIDPTNMLISTGGLFNGNATVSGNAPAYPAFFQNYSSYGDSWSYPSGWWVVGALFNGTVAPPWQ
jgi:hypothetical protein